MKYLFTFFISLFISITTFSQVITLECNNEIIIINVEELGNDINAYIDWNGDGEINEADYIIYLSDIYDCNIEDEEDNDLVDDEDNDWGDDEDNDWGDDEDNDWGDDEDND